MQKRKRDHVTPLLKELHWLPIPFRIQFKLATLAFRHFDNSLPLYLSQQLTTYQSSRNLRSSSEKLLKIPRTNLKSAGDRSFQSAIPNIWNSLPAELRNSPSLSSFKTNLKTYLFRQSWELSYSFVPCVFVSVSVCECHVSALTWWLGWVSGREGRYV